MAHSISWCAPEHNARIALPLVRTICASKLVTSLRKNLESEKFPILGWYYARCTIAGLTVALGTLCDDFTLPQLRPKLVEHVSQGNDTVICQRVYLLLMFGGAGLKNRIGELRLWIIHLLELLHVGLCDAKVVCRFVV